MTEADMDEACRYAGGLLDAVRYGDEETAELILRSCNTAPVAFALAWFVVREAPDRAGLMAAMLRGDRP